MSMLRTRLIDARKRYSIAAKNTEADIQRSGLSGLLSEKVVGIGVAIEWIRRAAEMENVSFIGGQLNRSDHKQAFVELLRFNFLWSGINGIYSRPSLLAHFGSTTASEYRDFLLLYKTVNSGSLASYLATLHTILASATSPRMPNRLPGQTVTTLLAIQSKYLEHASTKGGTAKTVAKAANSGSIGSLDLPTLIYAFRNWSVHGAALGGSFGSRPGFLNYVTTLQLALAEIHFSTADKLAREIPAP
jgi:hypothetical protein